MRILPWLLAWPPDPRAIAAFLVITALSLGTLVVLGGVTDQPESVTVEATDLVVRLNDEQSIPDTGNGSVQRCLASGTPGDRIHVVGEVTVAVPADAASPGDPIRLVVSLAHTDEETTEVVEATGSRSTSINWLLDDDETLSVGDNATIELRLRRGEESLTYATRTVPVERGSRTYDCETTAAMAPAASAGSVPNTSFVTADGERVSTGTDPRLVAEKSRAG